MANQKGTSSHDTLRGTINNDLLEGLAGNDHLYGLAGNDVLRGGDGFDVLIGEGGNDTLDGGAHDDWFYGGVGNDRLTGGSGADRFVFETGLNATNNVDTITDFTPGSDKIWLNHSIFNKLTVNGALDASMLRIGSAAADSNDYIIYNKDTGALIYDSNGNAAGGAVQFATIGKGLNLTANDFNVFGAPASSTITPTTPTTPTPTNPIPTSPTPTGVVTKIGSGSDTLVLKITQDAYQGDSQYAVFVDGKQIGSTFTAKALHNSGQFDTLEIKGDWGVGNHTVSVKLLNDLYGGSPTADRNVYVESATYNGSAVSGSYQYVNSAETKSFTVVDNTPIPSTTIPTPSPAPTPPSGSATLLFSTGFESGVSLASPSLYNSTDGYQDVLGTSAVWGTKPTIQLLSGGGTLSQVISTSIETTTGHNGTQTRALHLDVNQKLQDWTQSPLLVRPTAEPGDFYISEWIKLPTNLWQTLGAGGWLAALPEWKSAGDFRVVSNVVALDNGNLAWEMKWDTNANGNVPLETFWRGVNTTVPVPQGEWFHVEFFTHRSDTDGRTWLKVNGQTVLDHTGDNIGQNAAPINRVFLGNPYSNKPIDVWVDNVQIWDRVPVAYTPSDW